MRIQLVAMELVVYPQSDRDSTLELRHCKPSSINVRASLPLTNVDGEVHSINTQYSQGDCAILCL